jgi:choline dehydrogenase-like flavoprotein
MEPLQIVVGSGPAAVSAAVALLARGKTVWMLDGGADLEPEKAEKLIALSKLPPAVWPGDASLWMRSGTKAAVKGLVKLTYGSDFPYRRMPGATPMESEGVYAQSSMGKGGLSATWARAMPLGAQGRRIWGNLHEHEGQLAATGIKFGRSRLAIRNEPADSPDCCKLCGLCMYGCPIGLLYSSAQTVKMLMEHPRFRYMPGYVVRQVNDLEDGVEVIAARPDGSTETLAGDRVFLGAGVLSTAAIMLRSLNAYDKPIHFKDSHYFMMPMLSLRGAPGFERGNLQTMAQIFLEIMDDKLSPFATHCQIYTYNDLFEQPIRGLLRSLSALFPWDMVMSRLTVMQVFIHSAESPGFFGRLEKHDGSEDSLRLTAEHLPGTDLLIAKLMKKLWSIRGMTGLLPVAKMLERGEPGRGFHTGGTFPMSNTPNGFESDLLGRPTGMKRVHLIDSSVLPSIPGTTITYTVMANAHRIGSLAGA